jgi:uncharacterized protein YggE
MAATFSPGARNLAIGALVLAAAGSAYAIGAGNRPAGAAQTVYALPAANQSPGSLPGITVTGVGNVDGTPDTLTLNLTVSETRPDVSAALAAVNGDMNAVDAALTGHGVANADLMTAGAQLQPNYTSAGKINGYFAAESLTAKLRDLKTAGAQISAAAGAGGNAVRIDGVSLDIEHNSSLMNQARSAAFADAKAKAQQYASAAGETLGRPTQISETVDNPPVINGFAQASAGSVSPVPIKPGSAQLSVSVTVVFAVGN